ncbi:MAG: heme A synthase [Alphaproteobacteria bacterium]|nr:heme A synthase [Alphaproteobacteria bacterium]MBT5389636.1 heme A synthase [Alphaproteobacteria bacterium]
MKSSKTNFTFNATSQPIGLWLLGISLLILAMVALGGVTRLTGSGLSIVEWQPIMGILPPFSYGEWAALFNKYQQTPEFIKVNFTMDLRAFKSIFWLEYFHRLLGRLLGLIFILPAIWFCLTGQLRGKVLYKIGGLFILGGLQGVMGWYMVKSGLVDIPWVSPYRLTAHLVLALVLYAFTLWIALQYLFPHKKESTYPHKKIHNIVLALTSLTICWGALVAGHKAGLIYNTFPLMGQKFFPNDLWHLRPLATNFFENPVGVQFAHRVLAMITLCSVGILWQKVTFSNASQNQKKAATTMLAVAFIQVALGITTLVLQVPLLGAILHQMGAFILLTSVLWMRWICSQGAPSLQEPQTQAKNGPATI